MPVAVDYIHVLRYRDGQHISFNLMFDRLLMLEQLGSPPGSGRRRLSRVRQDLYDRTAPGHLLDGQRNEQSLLRRRPVGQEDRRGR